MSQTHSRFHTLAHNPQKPLSKQIPQNHWITVRMQQCWGGNTLMGECVNRPPGVSQGLRFVTENLPRKHSDSDLSWRAEGWSDQLHVRATGVNDRHSGGRWMNGAGKLLAHQTLFESCISTNKEGEVGTVSTRDTRICSSVDTWTGLKIDQDTIKFATDKVNAASVSAIASSTEAEEQGVQIDELTSSDTFQAKSVGSSNLLQLFQFVPISLSLPLSHSLPNFSHLLSHFLIKKIKQKCHKIQVWMLMCQRSCRDRGKKTNAKKWFLHVVNKVHNVDRRPSSQKAIIWAQFGFSNSIMTKACPITQRIASISCSTLQKPQPSQVGSEMAGRRG